MMKEALEGTLDLARLDRDKVPSLERTYGGLILLALIYLQSRIGLFNFTML